MASLAKRNGKWQARVRKAGFKTQTRSFYTKAEANEWVRQVESEMTRKVFIDRREAESTTIRAAFERYLDEITPTKRGAKAERNRILLICRNSIADKNLAELKSSDVAKWRDTMLKEGKLPSTVKRNLAALSHLYTIAVKEWSIAGLTNPVRDIRKPREPAHRDYRILPADEEALLIHLEGEAKAFAILAVETGMRRRELQTMVWARVKPNKMWVPDEAAKNGTGRWVPLSTRAREALQSLPRRIDGQVWSYGLSYYSHHFKAAARKAKLPHLRLHDCRHELTSRLFEAGWGIMHVAAVTGHKDLKMLQRYTQLQADDLAEKMG